MQIRSCKTNHIKNPLGYTMKQVIVSWVTESMYSQKQQLARIQVALNQEMTQIIYDTGEGDFSSLGTELNLDLTPYTRYYWTVWVKGNCGDEATSSVNWFETGKMGSRWEGKWIAPIWEDKNIHPIMEKSFNLESKKIKRARIYMTGLGLYEMELNGRRVGNEYFTPGCTAYDAWIQVQTYDITEYVQAGKNKICVLLGNGWAKGRFGRFTDKVNSPYTDTFSLLAELRVEYDDGEIFLDGTDETWQVRKSPIILDSIYDGEVYDLSLKKGKAENVMLFDSSRLGKIEDRYSLPVLVKEIIRPKEIIRTSKGEIVLDMGQNIAGWVRMRINEPKGTRVGYICAETLQNGNFYRDNLQKAKAEYWCISDGKQHIVEPHFTYYGFRYVKLVGFTKKIKLDDFEGCVVYSDLERTGDIQTGDKNVNRLFKNALWSQKDNFLDVPTDCPQRDERMGWTGDAQVFCKTASFNMDTYAFYNKYMHDVYEEQKMCDGMVRSFVPSFMKNKNGTSGIFSGGSSVWGDCATIIPWTLYLQYGDDSILKNQYESMKEWIEWIIREDEKNGGIRLRNTGFHFGDWLALDGPQKGGTKGGTEETYIATIYYYFSAEIMTRCAEILGKNKDAFRYQKLAKEVKKAIQKEYFSESGRCVLHTQTAYILALQFHLVSEENRKRVVKDLVNRLEADGKHLKTGFVGTPFLCNVLSENGYTKLAYDIFLQEDYPGWLYEVCMGATTIWERWDSILPDGSISGAGMNSLNHYSYGAIIEWMYRYVAGIRLIEDAPGYTKFEICPEMDERIKWAKASYQSPMGMIKSAWKYKNDNSIEVNITVPFGSEAVLILEKKLYKIIFGIESLRVIEEEDKIRICLTTGSYKFILISL